MSDKFVGVILAAGKGTRMAPFSEHYPKPILPVCNQPLLEHQIALMKSAGISKVYILIGHKGFEITKRLGDGGHLGINIQYIEQTKMLGIAHAIGHLENHIDKPFLLFLGDIYFVPNDINAMMEIYQQTETDAVLAVIEEQEPEAIKKNYSVQIDDNNMVKRVIEKPRYTKNNLKGIGAYLFNLTIFDAIRRTPRTAMRDEYEITEAIQVLIDDGAHVKISLSIKEDINLTFPSDLLRCNMLQLESTQQEVMIGSNCDIHPNAIIKNCVIGNNVKITHPIKISNSLVFENTCLDSNVEINGYIATPEVLVDCKHHDEVVRNK